ncbi:MAG: hypothetical protein KBC95_03880 [Candidatus Peribacteraceae bacterium]|nr:hypothetical protein [Candidatus Peribacteraceae bacterium]
MPITIPSSLASLDHGAFDAQMVATWQPSYPWTTSKLETNGGITPADYVAWTKHQLALALASEPKVRSYNFGDEQREALTYAAYEIVRWAVQTVHLRQQDVSALATQLRRDFARCLSDNKLLTADERSPLWKKGIERSQSGGRSFWELPLTSRFDRGLLEVLAGGAPTERGDTAVARIVEILRRDPFAWLASLDRRDVEVKQEDWRKKMLALTEKVVGRQLLYRGGEIELEADDRRVMLNATLDSIADEIPISVISETSQDEIAREQWLRDIAAEIPSYSDDELAAHFLRILDELVPDGLPRAEIERRLYEFIRDNFPDDRAAVALVDPPAESPLSRLEFVRQAVETAFTGPIAGTTPDDIRRLEERTPLLEYHLVIAATDLLNALLKEEDGGLLDEAEQRLMEDAPEILRLCQDWATRAYRVRGPRSAQTPVEIMVHVVLSAAGARVDPGMMRSVL